VNAHLVAGLEIRPAAVYGIYLPAPFMPHDKGNPGGGVKPVEHMKVGTADTGKPHADDHLFRAGAWNRRFDYAEFFKSLQYDFFHDILLQ
jgi:hypothetical protein